MAYIKSRDSAHGRLLCTPIGRHESLERILALEDIIQRLVILASVSVVYEIYYEELSSETHKVRR